MMSSSSNSIRVAPAVILLLASALFLLVVNRQSKEHSILLIPGIGEDGSKSRKDTMDDSIFALQAETDRLINKSTSKKESSIVLAGMLKDGADVTTEALNFLLNLNCAYQVPAHVLVGENVKIIQHMYSFMKMQTYPRGIDCPSVDFVEQPSYVSKEHNRIDRLGLARDYQRSEIKKMLSKTDNLEKSVVIVSDMDLIGYPFPMEVVGHAVDMSQGETTSDVLCAAGIEKYYNSDEEGYYDTYATILQPDTFLYPLAGRVNQKVNQGEDPGLIIGENFSHVDALDWIKAEGYDNSANKMKAVPVKSCFGGLTLYRASKWLDESCLYDGSNDYFLYSRYGIRHDDRACEHVVFNTCLQEKHPKLTVAIQPDLRTWRAKDASKKRPSVAINYAVSKLPESQKVLFDNKTYVRDHAVPSKAQRSKDKNQKISRKRLLAGKENNEAYYAKLEESVRYLNMGMSMSMSMSMPDESAAPVAASSDASEAPTGSPVAASSDASEAPTGSPVAASSDASAEPSAAPTGKTIVYGWAIGGQHVRRLGEDKRWAQDLQDDLPNHGSNVGDELIWNGLSKVNNIPNGHALVSSYKVRSFSFPSIEQRVKYYMGNFYARKEPISQEMFCNDIDFYSDTEPTYSGDAWLYDRKHLEERIKYESTPYADETLKHIVPKLNNPNTDPLVMHMGDDGFCYRFPVLTKTRPVDCRDGESAIILPLNRERHFKDTIENVKQDDVAWSDKKATLVWRGAMTGHGRRIELLKDIIDAYPVDDVDIGFSELAFETFGDDDPTPKTLLKSPMFLPKQLTYKYLLSLEGNDVSSGLKWMLYSNSVVFMPPPTVVSWAMEDQLVPYYHYIPLEPDLSDLYDKIQWARDNDKFCEQISKHATEFMEDLWMSDKAKKENEEILSKVITIYQDNYGDVLSECSSTKRW